MVLITEENKQEILKSFSSEIIKKYKPNKGGRESFIHKIEKLYVADMFLKQGYTVLFEQSLNKNNRYCNFVDVLVEKENKKYIIECISFQWHSRTFFYVLKLLNEICNRYSFILRLIEEQEKNRFSKCWFLVVPEEISIDEHSKYINFNIDMIKIICKLSKTFNFQLVVAPYHRVNDYDSNKIYKFKSKDIKY